MTKTFEVNIDFPKKHDGIRADGELATSFTTIKEMIDRAVEIGFNTISFDVDCPIDYKTGELQFTDIERGLVSDPVTGENIIIHEDVWLGIEYAEGLGLQTVLDFNVRILDPHTSVTNWNVGKDFSTDKFFESVTDYQSLMAVRAERLGVDAITIGSRNFGFDQDVFKSEWTNVIETIRENFSGSLRYISNLADTNIALWDLVDSIVLVTTPKWPLQSDYLPEDFVPLYFQNFYHDQNTQSELTVDEYLQYYTTAYPNKAISLRIQPESGNSAGNEFKNIWDYYGADEGYPEEWVDYELNSNKIAGFYEYIGNYWSEHIDGISFYQYAPWTEYEWLRNPGGDSALPSIVRSRFYLNYDEQAEQTLDFYQNRGWGFHTLHYGTIEDDVLTGTTEDDTFFASLGSDSLDGGGGVDRVVFGVVRQLIDFSTKEFSIDGDSFSNIERLEFLDTNLALDVDGSAGQTAKTLAAVIGADGLSNKEYVGIGLQLFDSGQALAAVCEMALTAVGATTNEDVVNLLYTNLFGEAPTEAQAQEYVSALDAGVFTKGSFAAAAAELTDDLGVIDLVGLAETGIEYV